MALEVGSTAPSFTLASTSGETVSLASLRGKRVVLYFYPRDLTPGCTQESCDFRDRHGSIARTGAVVLGVSKDSLASHDKFREKYSLPFPLLSDPDSAVAKKYGAHGEKLMYGKPVIGTIRSTIVVDEAGRVARVWSPVRVAGHADEVLDFLKGDGRTASAPSRKATAARPSPSPSPSTRPAKKASKPKTATPRTTHRVAKKARKR